MRWIGRMIALGLVLLAAPAMAQTCDFEGTITHNGSPVLNEVLICHHSGGAVETSTDDLGMYACTVDPGPVSLETRGQTLGTCPDPCDGSGETFVCNANTSCGCANCPSSLALLLLPPTVVLPARRRKRSASCGGAQ